MPDLFYGRGERAQTFDLSVPNRARYQLRHTPICVLVRLYTIIRGFATPLASYFISKNIR